MTDTQLRLVLEAIPPRVSLLDREQRHCYVNNEYAELAGRPVGEILGRTVAEVPGDSRIRFAEATFCAGIGRRNGPLGGWLPFRHGGRVVQRVYLPYRAESGAIEGYFVFAGDEKLAALGSLLAGVAHELNNPLAILIGNALMLPDEAERVSQTRANASNGSKQWRSAAAASCAASWPWRGNARLNPVQVEFLIGCRQRASLAEPSSGRRSTRSSASRSNATERPPRVEEVN